MELKTSKTYKTGMSISFPYVKLSGYRRLICLIGLNNRVRSSFNTKEVIKQ